MKKEKTLLDLIKFLEKNNLEYSSCKDYIAIVFYNGFIRFSKDTLKTRYDSEILKEGSSIEDFIKILPKAIKLKSQLSNLKG